MSEPKSDLKAVEAFYLSVLGSLPHLPVELLLSAVEERLSPREQSRVDDHLGACEYCRQDFQALRRFAKQQPSAPRPALVISFPLDTDSPEENHSESAPVLRVVEAPSLATAPSPTMASQSTAKPARSALIPGLFLALNALGLGALYGKLAPKTPVTTPSAPISAPAASPAPDTTRLQAVYERERAQLRGKISQLEKQLQTLRSTGAPSLTPPVAAKPVGVSALFPPSSLLVDRPPISLTVHPIISWKATPKVHHYSAELVDPKGKSLVKTQTTQAEWRITTALARGKSYRWKITPQDRSNKPLSKPRVGVFSVASDEQAKRLQAKLTALAVELESLRFPNDAQALKARAALIQKR
ncbi:hypothetical protein [Armatimonas sp.]|uniref:zf-HC2 domain-containing protein n=1 Tax=Armatimonas sp. TaxID=1872638 RepID=UPI003752F44E